MQAVDEIFAALIQTVILVWKKIQAKNMSKLIETMVHHAKAVL